MNSPTDAPPVLTNSNDKLWIVLSHLSSMLGVGIVLPLIIYLVKKDDSPTVGYHAKEALNFHISVFIYLICCFPLVLVVIGFPLMLFIGVAFLVLSIVAAVRSADGEAYRYPCSLRLIK